MDSKSEFPPDDPAVLAFTIELPMTAESFNSKGSEIKAAIAEAAFASAAGDADSSKVAFTGTPKEHSMSKVNDAMCTKPSYPTSCVDKLDASMVPIAISSTGTSHMNGEAPGNTTLGPIPARGHG